LLVHRSVRTYRSFGTATLVALAILVPSITGENTRPAGSHNELLATAGRQAASPSVSPSPEAAGILLTEGLAVAFPEGSGQIVLPYDPLEYQLITGRWAPPRAGDKIPLTIGSAPSPAASNPFPSTPSSLPAGAKPLGAPTPGTKPPAPPSPPNPPASSASSAASPAANPPIGTWQPIKANTQGWFEDKALGCGYVYIAYMSPRPQVLILDGFAHDFVYVNGEPRIGNRYGQSETYRPLQPRFDYSRIPVQLRQGRNDFLFRCLRGRLKVRLSQPPGEAFFNAKDLTLPDLVVGETAATRGAIAVVNASVSPLRRARISVSGPGLNAQTAEVPDILPLTVRKVAFPLEGPAPDKAGEFQVEISLLSEARGKTIVIDKTSIPLRAVGPREAVHRTYTSDVDGSVQHYAVLPAQRGGPASLVLTLHGAGVEAYNQARSYSPKTWANIVAPTNRRPYGFNWEDWGRIDALAVLAEARKFYDTDPSRVYLTGHSMGGHGAWMLGALCPDRFGAIGPSAGWISFVSYKVRTPVDIDTPMGRMIMRAFLPSSPYALDRNYLQDGVYILHGEKDDDVPVTEARDMAAALQKFHPDFVYHEQPGVGHWWDASPEAGVDCVDWPPMFDFFARHARAGEERVRDIEFVTPCPGISASSNWLTIEAQIRPLELSSARLHTSPADGLFSGTTENVGRLSIDLTPWGPWPTLTVGLGGQKLTAIPWPKGEPRLRLALRDGKWEVTGTASPKLKGPERSGLFKDAFKNRAVLVFGTHGARDENAWAEAKARYDAETFWYQGNGSLEVIPDSEFAPARFADRNVIIYGHAEMNSAWSALLGGSPVEARRGRLTVGGRSLRGADLGCLFIRPRPDSVIASVGVVAGTGLAGLRLTDNLPYLYPGYGFPDLLVARPNLLVEGIPGIETAGFFGPDWRVETGDFVWRTEGR